MKTSQCFTLDDLRIQAKRRIPKVAFDYLDGGVGTEANIAHNRKGFDDVILVPEYCRDVTLRSQKVNLFGHAYDAPVGLGNLIWPKAETYIAAMANKRNIPYGVLGQEGTEHVLDIFCDEIDRTIAQIGCTDINELDPHYLWQNHQARN